jgi:hypothetical protein
MGLDNLNRNEIEKTKLIEKYRPILAKKLGLNIEEVFPKYEEEENEYSNT